MSVGPATRVNAGVHGALLGACVGAASAVSTVGSSRRETRRTELGRAAPDVARVGPYAPLFDPSVGGTPAGPWALEAVRAGLMSRCDPMAGFVDGLSLAGRPRLEAAAVACVGAGVSASVDGSDPAAVRSLAVMAADLAAPQAVDEPGPDLGVRVQWACAVATRTQDGPDDVLDVLVGTTSAVQECVPAALALLDVIDAETRASAGPDAGATPDVVAACARAAALGGACDVVALVVGAVLGARVGPHGFPDAVVDAVDAAWPRLRELAGRWAAGR